MFADGLGDFRIKPLPEGVGLANHSLKRGELADHQRRQVSLGQPGRLNCLLFGCRGQPVGQPAGQLSEAGYLVVAGSQAFVVDDALQVLDPAFKALFGVLYEEELRVSQPGPQHPLVAGPDHLRIVGQSVVDCDEERQEFPLVIDHGEVLLVFSHGRD